MPIGSCGGVEHRLQLVRDLQTHDLPPGPARPHHAGALAGPRRRRRARGRVRADHRASCASIHERLFYRPLLESFAGPAQLHPDPRHRSPGDRGAAGRARLRRARPFLRRAGAPRRSDEAHREGARPPVPGHGTGARALADARRGPCATGTHRRGGRRRPRRGRPARDRPGRRPPPRPRRRPPARSPPTCSSPSPRGSAASRTRCSAAETDAPGDLVDAVARTAGRELHAARDGRGAERGRRPRGTGGIRGDATDRPTCRSR